MILRGTMNGRAILTEAKVRQLRRLAARGWVYRELGEKFGVSMATAWCAAVGRTWKHVA